MPIDPKLLAAGIECHRAGDFQQAREVYSQLLAADHQNVTLLNLLGAVCIDAAQLSDAHAYLAQALRLNPAFAAAHDNLGLLLMAESRFADAAASFRRAAALDPQNYQTHLNLATALTREGQPTEAINLLRQLVRLAPADARAHFELATALVLAGHRTEAIDAYETVIRLKPEIHEAYLNLASICFDEKLFDDAVRWSRRAVELRPDAYEAHRNLGRALTGQEHYEEAIAFLQTAVNLRPDLKEAHHNLADTLATYGKFAAAVEHYRRVLELDPAERVATYNLGFAYVRLGNLPSALEQFNRAIERWPDYAEAHVGRATSLLLAGDFSEGFAEYEWRHRQLDTTAGMQSNFANGQPLAGRTVVLSQEGGLGDLLQFVRYATRIKEQGARVVVRCAASMHPILSRTPGIDAMQIPGAEMVCADDCIPMMSLPHRMQTTLETVPAKIPYVFADPRLIAAWQPRLAQLDGFKIGIVWQGSRLSPGDRERSIPLEMYSPLASVPGVPLVNLQMGPGLEQLSEFAKKWNVVDFGDEVDSSAGAFMDTAAIMKNLDLVITSDTAAAHLAGALGVNVWVALQRVPEWRWMLEGEQSPWYPTMRLFRQTRSGDWRELFERIAKELRHFVAISGGK